ncbi:MAG: competence protein CoiA [Paracoccaceae bacterium]
MSGLLRRSRELPRAHRSIMKFSNVGSKRVEAEPGLVGVCPACSAVTIAKCGRKRIWHWAHKASSVCDRWWEPETEWHRNWKSEFPDDWQEVVTTDKTGERHIADVRTPNGVTIEFQHSPISYDERLSREMHYNNLIWVVDGLRLKRDYSRYSHVYNGLRHTSEGQIVLMYAHPSVSFPEDWAFAAVPLIMDFGHFGLVCLWPRSIENMRFHFRLSRSNFVDVLLRKAGLIDEELLRWNVKYYLEKFPFSHRSIPVSVFDY